MNVVEKYAPCFCFYCNFISGHVCLFVNVPVRLKA